MTKTCTLDGNTAMSHALEAGACFPQHRAALVTSHGLGAAHLLRRMARDSRRKGQSREGSYLLVADSVRLCVNGVCDLGLAKRTWGPITWCEGYGFDITWLVETEEVGAAGAHASK